MVDSIGDGKNKRSHVGGGGSRDNARAIVGQTDAQKMYRKTTGKLFSELEELVPRMSSAFTVSESGQRSGLYHKQRGGGYKEDQDGNGDIKRTRADLIADCVAHVKLRVFMVSAVPHSGHGTHLSSLHGRQCCACRLSANIGCMADYFCHSAAACFAAVLFLYSACFCYLYSFRLHIPKTLERAFSNIPCNHTTFLVWLLDSNHTTFLEPTYGTCCFLCVASVNRDGGGSNIIRESA